jgi:ribosome-binding protein aMBF1 (putative translation factor)
MSVCKWCGKQYKKKHNRQIYCCEKCARYAQQEQKRRYNWNYNKHNTNYKNSLGGIGISAHKNHDPDRESEILKNYRKMIGLKVFSG